MEDANADLKKRAQSWISEIQTVVKGKKTMERTVRVLFCVSRVSLISLLP
jgi:hypothetical protein